MAREERKPVLVAQLVNCFGVGGTERQLVEQLRNLDQSRFRAAVFCLQKVGEYLPAVREVCGEPTELHLRGTLLRPNTLVQVHRLAQQLRDDEADLLHCHDFYSNLVGSAAARLARIPYIVSRRDMGAWIDWKRARVLEMVTRSAPRVMTNAFAIRDRLIAEERLPASRIAVIQSGLDLKRFDAESARPLVTAVPQIDGHPVVAMVANMKHPVKGHADAIAAAAAVVSVVPEARFLFVGDGELRPTFEAQARRLGLGDAIVFAGKRTDVPALLVRCRAGLCASHAEGLSSAIMEAMAARLPMVATAVGGNIEFVRDGRTGFVVRRGDATAMAQRLIDLLRDPERARRMGDAGRQRIDDDLTSARMATRIGSLYMGLLDKRPELRRAA